MNNGNSLAVLGLLVTIGLDVLALVWPGCEAEKKANLAVQAQRVVKYPGGDMVDTETQVVYRREQFSEGNSLPVELVVRDRRFKESEIRDMCAAEGLDVVWTKYVRAGDWDAALDPLEKCAKEILVLCRAPHALFY